MLSGAVCIGAVVDLLNLTGEGGVRPDCSSYRRWLFLHKSVAFESENGDDSIIIIVTYTRSTIATRVKPLELAWKWRRLLLLCLRRVAATISAIRLYHYRLLLRFYAAASRGGSLNVRHKGAPLQASGAAVEADAFMSALGGS